MNIFMRIPLDGPPDQLTKLRDLQQAFSQVCNALAPLVQKSRCWNRVTLHYLYYKLLRNQFPNIGSQMVCNAIYSVSRTSRLVYDHQASPFNLTRLIDKPLPLLRFSDSCPVYFDRHTLSVKNGQLSIYTLDGRIRFNSAIRPQDEVSFHQNKLREIVLTRSLEGNFELSFLLQMRLQDDEGRATSDQYPREIPEYLMIDEAA